MLISISLSFIFGTSFFKNKTTNSDQEQDINYTIKVLKYYATVYPEKTDYLLQLGEAYQSNNQIEEAIEIYQKILKTSPNNFLALLRLGNFNLDKGNFDASIDLYKKSIESDKDKPGPYMSLSEILLLYNNKEALNYAQQCYDIDNLTEQDGSQYAKQYLQYVKNINEKNSSAPEACIDILNNYVFSNKLKIALANKFLKEFPNISETQKNKLTIIATTS